jgi:hypothetical protein
VPDSQPDILVTVSIIFEAKKKKDRTLWVFSYPNLATTAKMELSGVRVKRTRRTPAPSRHAPLIRPGREDPAMLHLVCNILIFIVITLIAEKALFLHIISHSSASVILIGKGVSAGIVVGIDNSSRSQVGGAIN